MRPLWIIFSLIKQCLNLILIDIQALEKFDIWWIKVPGKPLTLQKCKGLLRVVKSLPWPLPLTPGGFPNLCTSLDYWCLGPFKILDQLGLPKFSSKLMQRTKNCQTELKVWSGSVLVLALEHWFWFVVRKISYFWESALNWTFCTIFFPNFPYIIVIKYCFWSHTNVLEVRDWNFIYKPTSNIVFFPHAMMHNHNDHNYDDDDSHRLHLHYLHYLCHHGHVTNNNNDQQWQWWQWHTTMYDDNVQQQWHMTMMGMTGMMMSTTPGGVFFIFIFITYI